MVLEDTRNSRNGNIVSELSLLDIKTFEQMNVVIRILNSQGVKSLLSLSKLLIMSSIIF